MKIVFVCTGNTCRSPLAEGYLNSLKIPGVFAISRGLWAEGGSVSENSVVAAKKLGFDISGHISTQFDTEAVSADRIICMSDSHKNVLISAGLDPDKISVLGSGISDPYGQNEKVYLNCAYEIADAVDSIVFNGLLNGICVRRADRNDIGDISKLESACFFEPWSENAIKESLEAKTAFFVAVKDGKIIGYTGVNAVCKEGYITNIAVYENERGKGIGTLLMDRVFSFARKESLEFVSLEVRKSNAAAIALYKKLELKEEGLRKRFYSNPTEDAIIMTRRFI